MTDPLERILQILKGTRASPVSTIKGTDGKVIADPEESVRTLLDNSFWPDASQGDVEGDSELGRAREELELRAKEFEEQCRACLPDQEEPVFTEDEVRWTVMRRRGFKAPGPNMLFGRVLMEAGELLLPHLLVLYNACLALGYFPVFWKRDLEIALAKLGKAAYDVAKAYIIG